MRRILFMWALWCFSFHSMAQQSPWYSYGQDYFKIPTAQDGIYRLSPEALQQAGMNVGTVDPRNFKLFHRGKEVAIHVQGEQDGKFDSGDFIDFYGMRNDASLDSILYSETLPIPNPYFNTHTDTTAFFLTVAESPGKRMTVRPAPVNEPQTQSYQSERLQVFSEQYSLGVSYALGFRTSNYDQGQGWMSSVISKGATRQFVFDNLGTKASSGEAFLEIGLTGRSANTHSVRILAGTSASNMRQVYVSTFQGYESDQVTIPLAMSDFNSNGSITLGISPNGSESTDNVSVTYAKIRYQKSKTNGDFEHEIFSFPTGNTQLRITSTAADYVGYDIADPANPQQIVLDRSNGALAFVGSVQAGPSKILVQNASQIQQIDAIQKVRFRDYLSQKADFLLVGSKALELASEQFDNPLQTYAEHRASPIGGGFDTLTLIMEEIYDQYGYGERSPVALYEFLHTYFPVHRPTHMLLAGRGLAIYSTARSSGVTYFYRNNPAVFPFQDLVPVGGYPFSDNQYVIGLDPTNPMVPAMAVGRIPAKTSQQLEDYFLKAKEKDELGLSEPWQKELIHLGGGVSEFELDRYYNFLNGFKDIAEGPFLGGNVTTYRKRSNSEVEVIDITGDLNEGRSLVTFFGHGAPTILDIDIGFASDPTLNYQNKGKYPVMLFNGCDYGSAFGNSYTQGEDWVITPEKGASNIMANSAIGVDVYLRRYSDSFYKNAFADSTQIYKTVGEVKMEAERDFIQNYGTNPLNYSHMEQMILMGDPALRMFPASKVDYYIQESEAEISSFDELPISALSDSLRLSFQLRNIGLVNADSVNFRVKRRLPSGEEITYPAVRVAGVARVASLEFTIPNMGVNAAGENSFYLEINPDRDPEEMSYTNNQVTINQFIPLSGTLHLSPWDYGIVSDQQVELIAQIPGGSLEDRILIVQLDTTASFNSAFRKEVRPSTRGLMRWEVDLLSEADSMTYYWRSKYQEPKAGETDAWTQTSFSFIPNGPEGWTQRRFQQLQENQLENLLADESKREFEYEKTHLEIEVFTPGASVDTLSYRNTQFYINQLPYIIDNVNNANSRLCPNGSLGLVTFQQKTLQPYLPVPVPGFDILDSRSCGKSPQLIQSIQNSWITTPGNTMLSQFTEGVEEGDYVVIFSVGNVTFDSWPDEAYQLIKQFGASEVTLRALQTGDPYILYGRKGMQPGEAIEIVGNPDFEVPASQQTLSFDTELDGYLTNGKILTPRIGPASSWERFFQHINDKPWFVEEGNTSFDILGVRDSGQEDLLMANESAEQIDLSFVSPETYPYLRLRYAMSDSSSTAPSDLDRWQVNYTGVPEGALVVKNQQSTLQLQEGELGYLDFEFVNISDYDFLDSIQVDWKLTNTTSKQVETFSKKFAALKAGESLSHSIEFNSKGHVGEYEVEIFANPRILREQTYRNNQMDLGAYFSVAADDSQSLLDVNFEGIYIMDGDIVSPNVLINAILKNDQTLLYKTDTLGLDIFLKSSCESCDFTRLNFSDPNLTWTPASEDSDFRVSLMPGPLEDGIYTLRVQNDDSPTPYEVTFEVINESTITNFYPYPNPFSTSVRFVFTVTGSQVPDEIKIQIMTVTGKVVREILQQELGPLRIGNNLTEYAWDGKDEFGDQLANGVYIYRVLVRIDGQFVEHRPTAGDRGFKKGYGKMYLLR
ncbi:C25 family cysteine peptidase [Algoriphagus vanfongensis]|uniref:putative type IX secretion system sortase PorU2 n=1 Tax=Algoriphagus vanfongensis TaxID=426371 RepID=UPI00047BCE44|nr:C25 family cysteine peptidase [Algoriphagus vanfongensis]